MVDIALSRNDHDVVLVRVSGANEAPRFRLVMAEGLDLIAQKIKIRLQTFLGEWFLDITHGVPYFEDILIKNPREGVVATLLRGQVRAVEGVRQITSMVLEMDHRKRILTVSFNCDTVLGPISDSFRLDLPRDNT